MSSTANATRRGSSGRVATPFSKGMFSGGDPGEVRLMEAPSFVQPITVYDSRSRGASDYRELTEAIIKQEQ